MTDLRSALRAPTSHLADHATHIHLVCLGCGSIRRATAGVADGFAGNLRDAAGFEVDVTHMAVHGWCDQCSANRT